MDPLISVIVPFYNSEKYLKDCIESILNQTYTNFELILIDDGSKDQSSYICDEYAQKDSRIKVIHKENEGPGVARNYGLDIAKGEYISFIDSDDFVEIEYLNYLKKLMESEDCDLVIGGLKQINYSKQYFSEIEKNHILKYKTYDFNSFVSIAFLYWYFLGVVGRLYKREKIRNQRFLNLKYSEDFEFNFNYLMKTRLICIIEIPQYLYIQNNNISSLTHQPSIHKANAHLVAIDSILRNLPCDNLIIRDKILEMLFGDIPFFNFKNKEWKQSSLKTLIHDLIKTHKNEFLRSKKITLKQKVKFILFWNIPYCYNFILN